jgi:hypothetical protein
MRVSSGDSARCMYFFVLSRSLKDLLVLYYDILVLIILVFSVVVVD